MALLNINHLKSLVAVGSINKEGNFACDSTSFLVGFIAEDNEDPKKKQYWTFLVTNRHVFQNRTKAFLRFNTSEGKVKVFEQDLFFPKGETRWLAHSDGNVDLALLHINPGVLKQHGIEPISISEDNFAYSNKFGEIGIAVGDDVYAIGFPMGIAGDEQNYACVKAGIISRIDQEILKTRRFIIDSSIFPGNSGGPVILKPTVSALSDTKSVNRPYLLGVISGYIPYSEKLYTHQSNPPSIASMTRENSGLSFCVPMDFVKEIHDEWRKKNKPVEEPQKSETPQDTKEEVKTTVK